MFIRRSTRIAGACAAAAWLALAGPEPAAAAEPVATFSIVGRDAETGELGIAVQSKFFAVGAVVPWAEAEVGAVATQAFANTRWGPEALERLAAGATPEAVIAALTEADEGSDARQLGIVDAEGRAAAFTGDACLEWAGHEVGEGFTAQGNILTGRAVVEEMARAYRETDDVLGEKLMRALEAGQAAGGDSRGMQSAAILIVKPGGGYAGFNDRYCDLRVDDHADPIAELRRIFDLWKWSALVNEGYTHAEEGRWEAAFAVADRIIAVDPTNGESYYHPACFRSKAGELERALELLEQALALDPSLARRAAQDPDFAPLYENETFLALTSPREAAAAD